jgi:hypothetical protein
MGKEYWIVFLLRVGLWVSAGVAIAVDSAASHQWFVEKTNLDGWTATAATFMLSVVCASFGTLILSPGSWQRILMHTRTLASIKDDHDRQALLFGYALAVVVIILAITATYWINISSNYLATGSWGMACMIAFAADICLMMAAWFGTLLKAVGEATLPKPAPASPSPRPSRFKAG